MARRVTSMVAFASPMSLPVSLPGSLPKTLLDFASASPFGPRAPGDAEHILRGKRWARYSHLRETAFWPKSGIVFAGRLP